MSAPRTEIRSLIGAAKTHAVAMIRSGVNSDADAQAFDARVPLAYLSSFAKAALIGVEASCR